jgi:FSR family fosmidomycin resistance protein-like MFS transporter
MPLLGLIATHHGPRGALAVLATVPVLAMLLSTFLREPVQEEVVGAEDTSVAP